VLALASARLEDEPGVKQNFDNMLKQLAGMHRFIETEESAKKTLEVRKQATDQAVAKVENQNTQLRAQMQNLEGRFQKVEGAWVKTAVDLQKARQELTASEETRKALAKENALLKAKLATLAQDWRTAQTAEEDAASKLTKDWAGINEVERNTTNLHLGPPPPDPEKKVPVLSPLFQPRPAPAPKQAAAPAALPPLPEVAPAPVAQPVPQAPAVQEPAPAAPAPANADVSMADFASLIPSSAAEVPLAVDAAMPAIPIAPAAAPAPATARPLQAALAAPVAPAPVAPAPPAAAAAPAALPAIGAKLDDGLDVGIADERILQMARAAGLDLSAA